MLKTESLDKLEKLSKDIGIRSVLMVAWTEGYAQALRESFQKITEVTKPLSTVEELIERGIRTVTEQQALADRESRVLCDMEHAGISETHPMGKFN